MHLGQEVEISAGVVEWENRLKIVYVIRDIKTGRRVMRASSVQVAVEAVSGRMQWRSPPSLLEKLARYLP